MSKRDLKEGNCRGAADLSVIDPSNVRQPDTPKIEKISKAMKVLASPARLTMLYAIVHSPRTVGELTVITGLSQSALSQHLAQFREAGIVSTRKEGQHIWYTLDDVEIYGLLSVLLAIYR
ncbi:metalloregulator ArsR/SmtB family transcription factor [Asticcacaulis sp. BYS171W]|uniref:Metalloregulator ArsR/SmtB family transcription factor n=1 Tax=Asticcacaulis aquaticus TaxID=2984212 RepID=A0ABT5HXC8_9CAUL|nr:metalloregulator ArsR/SmtB family transcription factor [Asticcacaulis aquaticus]MDC7684500.1 metalloregulator ArsR/SmtB family transcription factor [Asticcacaulis aquaticus]